MIASLYVFFCCFTFPTLGCIVCVFLQPLQTIQTLFYQEIAYFYTFYFFFLRLKFSKTPFHVVLSKNKTNTKKKYHFSLLISVSFHSSQFFFALNLYTSEPLSRQKLTALVYVFVIFWGGFHFFFHSFFLDFFFFILLLKYTFLHAHGFYTTILLHVLLSFPPRVCVSIVSLN